MRTIHSHKSITVTIRRNIKSSFKAVLSKLAFLFIISTSPLLCNAQLDTLDLERLEPTYYYWDSNWAGYHALHTQYTEVYYGSNFTHTCNMTGIGTNFYYQKIEYARYFHSDSTIRILGVAAPFTPISYDANYAIADTTLKNRDPDYFILYDYKGGAMTPIDSARNDTALHPKYLMMTTFKIGSIWLDPVTHVAVCDTIIHYSPVREVYFKNPINMQGDFYVGGTHNNNYVVLIGYDSIYIPAAGGYLYSPQYRSARPITFYCLLYLGNKPNLIPKGPRQLRAHLVDQYNDQKFSDTLWHMDFHRGNDLAYFLIFDTSTYVPPVVSADTCPPPIAPRVMNQIGDTVTFIWNGPDSVIYELSVERSDSPGIETHNQTVPTQFATLIGFDTATWYTARVRTLCDSNNYSEWSDSIEFYIPAPHQVTSDDDSTTIITDMNASLEEEYTLLMPNPAFDIVNIISSFYVNSVTLYTIDGRVVYHDNVGAIGTNIKVSSFPRGTYIVRITTSRGHVFKKLILR